MWSYIEKMIWYFDCKVLPTTWKKFLVCMWKQAQIDFSGSIYISAFHHVQVTDHKSQESRHDFHAVALQLATTLIAQIGFDNYRWIGSVTFAPHPPKVIESEKLSGPPCCSCAPHTCFRCRALISFGPDPNE